MKKVKAITALFSTIFLASLFLLLWWSCETEKVDPVEPPLICDEDTEFISGTITDSETDLPISSVLIQIEDKISMLSDDDGSFSTTTILIPGTYEMITTKDGYIPIKFGLEIVADDQSYVNLIELSMTKIRAAFSVNPINGATISENSVDGKFSIEIPSEALNQTEQISMTPLYNADIHHLPTDSNLVINSVVLLPHGLQFKKPVTLTIPIPTELEYESIEDFVLLSYDPITNVVEELNSLKFSSDSTSIIVQITSFSWKVIKNTKYEYTSFLDKDPVLTEGTRIVPCPQSGLFLEKICVPVDNQLSRIPKRIAWKPTHRSPTDSICKKVYCLKEKGKKLKFGVRSKTRYYVYRKKTNGSYIPCGHLGIPVNLSKKCIRGESCTDGGSL